MKERRKYLRFPIVTNVKYKLLEEGDTEKNCLSKDLSNKGAKLLVRKKIAVGKKIKLSFYLPPDPEPVNAEGKVIWSKKSKQGQIETGIKFTHTSREIIEK
jgi:c-di-GMP-binding flagellar brake protein YcgR